MLDLEMLLDAATCTALYEWAAGAKSATDHLDRPRVVPCADVMVEQSEDEMWLLLPTMKPERRKEVLKLLGGVLQGYPWIMMNAGNE